MANKPPAKSTSSSAKALQNRLKEKYFVDHLQKVRNAKAESDHRPVRINVNNYMRLYQLPGLFRTIMHNGHQNKRLVIDLAEIIMKPINPCAPESKDVALRKRKRRLVKEGLQKIAASNHLLVERIWSIKNPKQPKQSSSVTQQPTVSLVPPNIIKRFEHIVKLSKNTALQNKVFRPKIYFELEAKGERALGHMTFQLYTEACPLLVLQLVRFFSTGNCNKFRFPRLYASLWAESEIVVGGDNQHCDKYYDMHALDCASKQPGLLCFALQDFQILKRGILVFTINFRPITVNDGKRFAFGKLIGGRSKFLCLHEYGTKSGKPLKEIRVTSMGVL